MLEVSSIKNGCSIIVTGSGHLDKVAINFSHVTLLQSHCSSKIVLWTLHAPRIMDEVFYSLLSWFATSLGDYAHPGTADEFNDEFLHPIL